MTAAILIFTKTAKSLGPMQQMRILGWAGGDSEIKFP